MSQIHPLALVESGTHIARSAVIEAFAVVKRGVKIGPDAIVKSHAHLEGRTRIGDSTVIWPGACIGGAPQDLKYRGEQTEVVIGNHCQIRECATINCATQQGQSVTIGDHCLLMAYTHVAHNCHLGDRIVMSNGATLAGHVVVEEGAVIGGMTAVHQFSRIGRSAMVGGMSRITRDIPPYTLGAGSPYRFGGINLVGLERRRADLPTRRALAKAFRLTFRCGLKLQDALALIKIECPPFPEIEHWLHFCQTTTRGLIGLEGSLRGKTDRNFSGDSKTLKGGSRL